MNLTIFWLSGQELMRKGYNLYPTERKAMDQIIHGAQEAEPDWLIDQHMRPTIWYKDYCGN